MFIHGAYRATTGGVAPFGGWLSELGFPGGVAFAWTVTLLELLATPLLAAGKFVAPIAAWFAFQLVLGMALVHAREGWFVVGGGRNGVEYSVLLVTCLVVLILDQRRAHA
jgi:putative oxidoreductase